MSDVYSLISEDELTAIERYIQDYAIPDGCDYHNRASINYILRVWKRNKANWLGEIFGNKLIYSEPVSYRKPESELCMLIFESTKIMKFKTAFHNWVHNQRDNNEFDFDTSSGLLSLLESKYLASNIYSGMTFSVPDPSRPGKSIKISSGCKTTKALNKIYNLYANHIDGDFEEFRIALSQILNTSSLSGNLCISIHPLDYMTMSDNECDWDSCMSWMNEGSYRQGTVEMMNSPYVVVAYLTAKDDMNIGRWRRPFDWNNKKWRSLYICSENFIGNVKGYPYQLPEVDKIVIERLRQMVMTRFPEHKYGSIKGYDFNSNSKEMFGCDLDFRTGYMYNDFGTLSENYGCINTEYKENYLTINYSGASECMMCGYEHIDIDHEGLLVCENCYHMERCDECGEVESYLIETGDGHWVCEDCLAEYYSRSINDNEYYRTDEMTKVLVLPDICKDNMDKIDLHRCYYVPCLYDSYGYDLSDEHDRTSFAKHYLKEGCEVGIDSIAYNWEEDIYYIFISDINDDWSSSFNEYCVDVYGSRYINMLKYQACFKVFDEAFGNELYDWLENTAV